MAYDPDTLLPVYVPTVPSNSLFVDGHEDELHEVDRQELRGLKAAFGLTPGVNDRMTYVRLGDAVGGTTGKGLWVPIGVFGDSLIVNGNFDHFQRGTGVHTNTTTWHRNTSFAADRIYTLPAGASVTSQRSTTTPDARSQYSLLVTGASSVTTVDIGQRIRQAIVATKARQSLVFSAAVQNNSGASFTPNLRIGTPSAADNFGTVTNRLNQALQACADSAWTVVHHVFDPTAYTDIANGMTCELRIPSGSLVSGDTVRIAQFDLRPSSQYLGYLPPDPDRELLRCLQYFEMFSPAAATAMLGAGNCSSSTTCDIVTQYAPKRANPSITFVNETNLAVYANGTTTAIASIAVLQASLSIAALRGTVASGLTTGHGALIGTSSTNEQMLINAELV